MNNDNAAKVIVFERLRILNDETCGTITCIGKINSDLDYLFMFPYFILKYNRLMYLHKYDIVSQRDATKEEEELFNYKYEHAYDSFILSPLGDEKRDYIALWKKIANGERIKCHFDMFTDEDLCVDKRYMGYIYMSDGRVFLDSIERNLSYFEICTIRNRYDKRNILSRMKDMNLTY